MLGYAIAGGLFAVWLNGNFVAVLTALVIGGTVVGGLLGRMLFQSPTRKDKTGAPTTDPERQRE
jgi:hypothetical protein